MGVDIFFVLSGFLITSLLLEEWTDTGKIDLRKFYWRRVLRLLPALLLLLTVAEVFALLRLRGDYFWTVQKAILGTLFYVANWMRVLNGASLGPIPHTWSLSVEEQFYILWPPLLLVGARYFRPRRMFSLVLVAVVVVVVNRIVIWLGAGESAWDAIYHRTDTRLDALLIGCACAIAFESGWLCRAPIQKVLRYSSVPASICVVYSIIKWMPHQTIIFGGWTAVQLSLATLICWLVSSSDLSPIRSALQLPPLIWIGRISYGLYLWHVPLFSKMGWLRMPGALRICLMFVAAFVTAGLSYFLVEKPILRFKVRTNERNRIRLLAE